MKKFLFGETTTSSQSQVKRQFQRGIKKDDYEVQQETIELSEEWSSSPRSTLTGSSLSCPKKKVRILLRPSDSNQSINTNDYGGKTVDEAAVHKKKSKKSFGQMFDQLITPPRDQKSKHKLVSRGEKSGLHQ